ncbi:MAG: DUF2071 domain-containing protein [Sphingobacteriales bacterium]|nr:MAG: DUF2071 domain-containing protein [Sphingobacteriales bacterium]
MLLTPSVFLQAEWKYLAMFNYVIPPELVEPYLPKGTETDFWNGQTYASLVGFLFENTKVKGIAFPYHTNFEEVNLRLYVRRKDRDGQWHRGVVFVREIVPRFAIAKIARWFYNEPYVCYPMKHSLSHNQELIEVKYAWKFSNEWNYMRLTANPAPKDLMPGSIEEFITEHYWGFNKQKDGSTKAYQVEHPKWKVYDVLNYDVYCNAAMLYGQQFAPFLQKPDSVLLAYGSEVTVRTGFHLP